MDDMDMERITSPVVDLVPCEIDQRLYSTEQPSAQTLEAGENHAVPIPAEILSATSPPLVTDSVQIPETTENDIHVTASAVTAAALVAAAAPIAAAAPVAAAYPIAGVPSVATCAPVTAATPVTAALVAIAPVTTTTVTAVTETATTIAAAPVATETVETPVGSHPEPSGRSLRQRKPSSDVASLRRRSRHSSKNVPETAVTTPESKRAGSAQSSTATTPEADTGSAGKRRLQPRRSGISWIVGAKLEAKDYLKNWYPARIVEVDEDNQEVLIHFDRWNSRFDEWLDMKSDRIRAGSFSSVTSGSGATPGKSADSLKSVSLPQICLPKIQEGSVVLAQWKSSKSRRRYPAKVKRVKSRSLMDIEFYDGVECEVLSDTVLKLPPSLQKQALHIWSLMSEINEEETEPQPDDKKASRRDVIEAKKALQSKIDEAEGLLTTLIDSAASLTAKVHVYPASAADRRAPLPDTIPAKTQNPPLEGISRRGRRARSPNKDESTSKKVKAKEKDKLVVAGFFKGKQSKQSKATPPTPPSATRPTPASTVPSTTQSAPPSTAPSAAQPTPAPTAPSATQPTPTSIVPSATQPTPASTVPSATQSTHESTVPSATQPTTAPTVPSTLTPTAPTSLTSTAPTPFPRPNTSNASHADLTPSEAKPASQKVRAQTPDVSDAKQEEVNLSEPISVKSEVDMSINAATTTTAPPEMVVTAVHVNDTISITTTVPVIEGQTSSSSRPDATTRMRTRKLSQPQSGDIPIGYAMVLETKNTKPAKAFVVEEDHNRFKCPHCSKSFRKDNLLQAHIKHYHSRDGRGLRDARGSKRRKTLSHCSSDSEVITPNSTTCSTPLASPIQSVIVGRPSSKSATSSVATPSATPSDALLAVGSPPDADFYMETDEGEDTDEEDTSYQSEIVSCICGFNEEDGLMIQCELCCCWQHAECFQIKQDEQPERYLCYVCIDTPGVRESSRYAHNQDWYRKGALPKLDFLMSISSDGSRREGIVRESHQHLVHLHNAVSSLKSMGRLLDSAQKRDMYELALWSPADHPSPAAGTEGDNDLEQRNLLLYLDKKQREMEQQLLAIDRSVSELENDAGVSSCTSADQLTASSNVLKRLMDDVTKVQKLASLTTTTADPSGSQSGLPD